MELKSKQEFWIALVPAAIIFWMAYMVYFPPYFISMPYTWVNLIGILSALLGTMGLVLVLIKLFSKIKETYE